MSNEEDRLGAQARSHGGRFSLSASVVRIRAVACAAVLALAAGVCVAGFALIGPRAARAASEQMCRHPALLDPANPGPGRAHPFKPNSVVNSLENNFNSCVTTNELVPFHVLTDLMERHLWLQTGVCPPNRSVGLRTILYAGRGVTTYSCPSPGQPGKDFTPRRSLIRKGFAPALNLTGDEEAHQVRVSATQHGNTMRVFVRFDPRTHGSVAEVDFARRPHRGGGLRMIIIRQTRSSGVTFRRVWYR